MIFGSYFDDEYQIIINEGIQIIFNLFLFIFFILNFQIVLFNNIVYHLKIRVCCVVWYCCFTSNNNNQQKKWAKKYIYIIYVILNE